jgi:hypothetical protein
MPRLTVKQQVVKTEFIRAWFAKYGRAPSSDVVGIAMSLVVCELVTATEEPAIWPASGIVPLLRRVAQEATE